jgi:hypothetical protein
MIRFDLSNAVPKRVGTYFLTIIPGALFESSVAFGDPQLASALLSRVKQVYPFEPYALLIIFLASCFLTGYIFFLSSRFADMLLGWVYRLSRYLGLGILRSAWVYRLLCKLQGDQTKKANIVIESLWHLVRRWSIGSVSARIEPVIRCQHIAVEQLLKRKYGIKPSDIPAKRAFERDVWLAMFGKQPVVIGRAFLTMRILLASGLATLASLYVAPVLRNRYFILISTVLLLPACIQSFTLAGWRYEPVKVSLNRLGWILTELAEVDVATLEEYSPGKKPSVTVADDTRED